MGNARRGDHRGQEHQGRHLYRSASEAHGSLGKPYETDAIEGRFIITSDQFLDAAVYHRGRRIAVVAEIEGRRILPLGEIEYQYPVLVSKELHLWEPSSCPQFFFGIGVSKGF